ARSADLVKRPRGNNFVNSWCVDPNTARQETICSPLLSSAANEANTAAIPDENANPASAPSIAHTLLINSVVFGFEYREYTFPASSSAKIARPCSALSKIKLEVK